MRGAPSWTLGNLQLKPYTHPEALTPTILNPEPELILNPNPRNPIPKKVHPRRSDLPVVSIVPYSVLNPYFVKLKKRVGTFALIPMYSES